MIDIVIPCHPKDYEMLQMCVTYSKKYVIDTIHRIYVITPHAFNCDDEQVVFICEDKFPFSRTDVLDMLHFPEKHDLVHWYLQQLLKIYSISVIDTLDHVLILDADTVFTKPVRFINENGICSFGYNDEKLVTNFKNHINKLLPNLECKEPSGVCDFQIWSKNVIRDLMKTVEEIHGEEFWKIFLKNTKEPQSASEYELYFQYYKSKYSLELIKGQKITTSEKSKIHEYESNTEIYAVSLHSWLGPRN